MSNDVKIELILNAEDASLVMSAIKTTAYMLNQSIDQALADGLLPVVKAARADCRRLDKIIEAIMSDYKYESSTFEIDEGLVQRQMEDAKEVLDILQKKMSEEPELKEEKGKDWDKAGDNVVSILDKFNKKDKPNDDRT